MAEDVQDTDDYKLSKSGRKIRAHRIIFNKGDDDGKKGITEMKKTYKAFVEQHTAELTEEQKDEIVAELEEALSGDLSAGEWIKDFVHSDNPKFEGKSKDKRKQMALAAYYAKQRNEEVELSEEATHTVDIDHMGGHDDNAKKHNITLKKTSKTGYSHDATGTKKNLQKFLVKHYDDDHEEAKEHHPEVFKEELKGNQHKLDKNKNGKLDKHDFKLLRKEDSDLSEEQLDELSKDTIKSYLDKAKTNYSTQRKRMSRAYMNDVDKYHDASVKSDARKSGIKAATSRLKEEISESADYHERMADQHANHANQHEKEASNDGHADHDYASVAHENAEKAHNAAAAAHKKHGADSSEYKKAAEHAKTATSNAKDESGHLRFRKVSKPAAIKESVFDWKNRPRQTSDSGKTKTYHDVKKVSTGTVYTKQFDKDGVSKGTGDDAAKKAEGAAKRGRGRPKKDKFAEAVEFLLALSEEHFDDMMEEGFDAFIESYEQLDELSKATLGSYAKKAKTDIVHRSYDQGSDDEMGVGRSKRNDRLLKNRSKGVDKAVDRLTK
jgi:hypothetical protein